MMSVSLGLTYIRRNAFNNDHEFSLNPKLYGKELSRLTYFCMFKGVISPKICESIATGKDCQLANCLNIPTEDQYSKLNSYLNKRATLNIEDLENENSKSQENDRTSTSAESMTTDSTFIDPVIAKMVKSHIFNEKISKSSQDYINTIQFVCE